MMTPVSRWLVGLSCLVLLAGGGIACSSNAAEDQDPGPGPTRDRDEREDEDEGQPGDEETLEDQDQPAPAGEAAEWTVEELVEVSRVLLDEFWAGQFAEANLAYFTADEFVAYDEQGLETACGPADDDNAFYCGLSHGVYYDEGLFQRELEGHGDYSVVFILAHEWGHLVQGLLGILEEGHLSIQVELQADCFAGAFTAFVDDEGLLEEGDVEEGVASLFTFGDRDIDAFEEGAHGSPGQRIDAFDMGLRGGSGACLPAEQF